MEKTAPLVWNELWVFGLFYLGTWFRIVAVVPLDEFQEMKEEFNIVNAINLT
jgi:hypothetical protein